MKLILLFAIWLCVSAEDGTLLRRFYLYTKITNKVCDNNNAVFGTLYATSLARCALSCKQLDSCASFFYSPAKSTCAGCNETYTHTVQLTGRMEGSRFYSKVPVDDRKVASVLSGCYSYYCGSTKCPSTRDVYSTVITKEWCLAYCRAPFAVQVNLDPIRKKCQYWCHCNFKAQVKKYRCSTPCSGNARQICGAPGGVMVYKMKYV